MYRYFRSSYGFTLIELMIVIAIIIGLLSTSIFPYSYYMERARVVKNLDAISAEWIIAHQDVRGGKLYDTNKHAYVTIDMTRGDDFITFSTSTGSTGLKKEYKKYVFDGGVKILGFTGSINSSVNTLSYIIAPPFATGAFSTGGIFLALSGVRMTIGYDGASADSGRSRDISLKSYFE